MRALVEVPVDLMARESVSALQCHMSALASTARTDPGSLSMGVYQTLNPMWSLSCCMVMISGAYVWGFFFLLFVFIVVLQ